MTAPKTLREIAGAPNGPATLENSVLIIVDAQNEYRDGILPLTGFDSAVLEIQKLLTRARAAHIPVIHVVHKGNADAKAFNCNGRSVAIVDELKPLPEESIIEKRYPSSFTQTELEAKLQSLGKNTLIVTGFMTHMCISSTTREAAERGYLCTIVEDACATRDLPDGRGGSIPAATIQSTALAALRDRFAVIVKSGSEIR